MKTIRFLQTVVFQISYILIRIPLYFLSLFPLSWLYGGCGLLTRIVFGVFKYRHTAIAKNLEVVFPDTSLEQRKALGNKFVRHFSDLLAESIKAFTMSRKELARRFDIRISAEMQAEFDNQRSIFICGAHINNWEWAVITAGDQLPVRTVAVYKPLSSRAMNQIMNDLRQKGRTVMVPMGLVLRDVLSKDQPASAYIFLSDQSTPHTMTAHWIDFFGLRTPFVPGMSTMASRYNIPIYYFSIQKTKRGHYTANFSLLAKDPGQYSPEEITALYSKKLRENILNQPAHWLWSHKRWKRVLQY